METNPRHESVGGHSKITLRLPVPANFLSSFHEEIGIGQEAHQSEGTKGQEFDPEEADPSDEAKGHQESHVKGVSKDEGVAG